ncbi:MAG: hypothetical protein COA32_10330 [Fluviicola sp.]|nr:MAG: hypothetical protein COA32_10330 [Fluviicola sp.]
MDLKRDEQTIVSIFILCVLFSCSNSGEDNNSTLEQKVNVHDTIVKTQSSLIKERTIISEPFKSKDIESLYFTSGGVSKAEGNEFCDSLETGIFGKYYLIDEDFSEKTGEGVGGTITVHVKEENIGWRADDTTQTIWKIHLLSDVVSVWDSVHVGNTREYIERFYKEHGATCRRESEMYFCEFENYSVENKFEKDRLVEMIVTRLCDKENRINYIDSNNLKQGKWITKGYKNKVVKIETFKNDTLNGYWFNWDGMQEDGNYSKGKKDGYFRVYYGDRSELVVMQLKYIANDSIIWSGAPAADSESAFPVKGFKVYKDSVLVKAPHVNGELWYKGLFIENEPKGIHSIFDRNGKLLARMNYKDSTVRFTNQANDEFIETSKMMSRGWDLHYK